LGDLEEGREEENHEGTKDTKEARRRKRLRETKEEIKQENWGEKLEHARKEREKQESRARGRCI
jgi:hypothetical protein